MTLSDIQSFKELNSVLSLRSTQILIIQELQTESLFPFKVDLVQQRDFADTYQSSYSNDKRLFVSGD